MRFSLLIFFVSASSSAFGQLKGFSYGDQEESFSFRSNDEFTWQRGKEVGDGTYKIKGDSIEFVFKKIERTFDLQQFKSIPNQATGSHIELIAMYSNGRPVEGMQVKLAKSHLEAATDNRGIATLDISMAALTKDQLHITLDNAGSTLMTIDLRGYDHSLGIVVDETDPKYHERQHITLAFKKMWRGIKLGDNKFKKIGRTG
jgi:hypothetical protein